MTDNAMFHDVCFAAFIFTAGMVCGTVLAILVGWS